MDTRTMEQRISIILISLIFMVALVGCYNVKPDEEPTMPPAPKVVNKPVSSCTAPPTFPRPAFNNIVFIGPLHEDAIVGLDEGNAKGVLVIINDLLRYAKELETALDAYRNINADISTNEETTESR